MVRAPTLLGAVVNGAADVVLPDLDANDLHRVVAHLKRQNSLSVYGNLLEAELPVFLPAGQRQWFRLHLKYPYGEKEPADTTPEQRKAYQGKLAAYVRKELGNLDGFILFDENRRFEIRLPSGW